MGGEEVELAVQTRKPTKTKQSGPLRIDEDGIRRWSDQSREAGRRFAKKTIDGSLQSMNRQFEPSRVLGNRQFGAGTPRGCNGARFGPGGGQTVTAG
jgi:hypothetical protein